MSSQVEGSGTAEGVGGEKVSLELSQKKVQGVTGIPHWPWPLKVVSIIPLPSKRQSTENGGPGGNKWFRSAVTIPLTTKGALTSNVGAREERTETDGMADRFNVPSACRSQHPVCPFDTCAWDLEKELATLVDGLAGDRA